MRTNDTFEVVRTVDPFTRINNGIFQDKRLNLKTLGLLCKCLSLPEDWRFSVRGLAAICMDGPAAVATALDSLEELGYLRRDRNQAHTEGGKFGSVRYVFFDTSQQPGAPCIDYPITVEPYTDNRAQERMKQETKKQELPPKPPRGRAAKKAPDHLPVEFDRLWKAYPRGEDKQGAIAEWDRLKPDEETIFSMQTALLLQKQTDEWRRGVGIPYFCRWLKHRRWEDEKLRGTNVPAVRTVEAPPGVAAW